VARVRLFSKRHERAIYDRRLRVSLSKRLCRRIWFLLERYNFYWDTVSSTNWHDTTDLLSELYSKLKGLYGTDELYVKDGDLKTKVNLQDFVMGAYPSQVLDVIYSRKKAATGG
jgi:hypothetical protein